MGLFEELKALTHNVICLSISFVQLFPDSCFLVSFLCTNFRFHDCLIVVFLCYMELAVFELKVCYIVVAYSCKSMMTQLLEVLTGISKIYDRECILLV